MYKCEICGKEFDTIPARNKCEAECLKIQESVRKAEQLAKYEEERKADAEKVEQLRLRAIDAVTEYEEAKATYDQKYKGRRTIEIPTWVWW